MEGSRALNKIKIGKYFSLDEFECRCCHAVKGVPYLVYLLDKLRESLGCPVYVFSGYRCVKQNEKFEGEENSYHSRGMAAHVFCRDKNVSYLAGRAEKVGFETVIVYRKLAFIHVDIREVGLGLIVADEEEQMS